MSREYDYYCTDCDCRFTGSLSDTLNCPSCNSEEIGLLPGSVRIGGGDYKTPIHSDSLAINPSQVTEHRKLFPNIEIDKQCRPVFNNYAQHKKYLNATGFVKLRQKIKPKGERVA